MVNGRYACQRLSCLKSSRILLEFSTLFAIHYKQRSGQLVKRTDKLRVCQVQQRGFRQYGPKAIGSAPRLRGVQICCRRMDN
jgi:hypothetical protein